MQQLGHTAERDVQRHLQVVETGRVGEFLSSGSGMKFRPKLLVSTEVVELDL